MDAAPIVWMHAKTRNATHPQRYVFLSSKLTSRLSRQLESELNQCHSRDGSVISVRIHLNDMSLITLFEAYLHVSLILVVLE